MIQPRSEKTMIGTELKSCFDHNSFVHLNGFLNKTLLGELIQAVEKNINNKVPNLTSSDIYYDDPEKPETLKQLHRIDQDPFFDNYPYNPLCMKTAQFLLDEPIEPALSLELLNKPPNTLHETPPHQDNYHFCLEPSKVLTIWVALDPVDDSNGCMRYTKETHNMWLRNHRTSSTLSFSQKK